ncbi:ATP-binding sensor histidine kinase [Pseudomonas sp. dw_358]|uniref:trifunctional serine/threonine-protein kinase/ATP-binding protein/sensor histidine kinase n=1 Tax=Pseudomonas sp. dw_358 TaxID=2720083 RepID=UPI001BD3B9E0|nr:ATP-binding sensor histidine kinase [Pseudomonas sp. dw_358]
MTSKLPTPPIDDLSTLGLQGQGFDEHWLRGLHWSMLDEDGGLVRWRVRSPMASRAWLIVRPRSDASDADFRRLEREWSLAAHLRSDWAVMPIAQLHTPEGPITVLDDDGGRPLSTFADGKLSVERFLRLAIGAASALAKAHEEGIVHGDIKPTHLILGPDEQIRLSGFALARHRLTPAGDTQGIRGSLPYMSPEQGGWLDQRADTRSDLYSLGVSFYELLTGRLPFWANDPVAWLHQHVAVPLPSLSVWRSGLPVALQDLLERLMAKSPDERLPGAALLAAQLRLALAEWIEFGHLMPSLGETTNVTNTAAGTATLPGRLAALAPLLEAGQRLSQQQPGGVLLLGAPAGMGKTTLVRRLRRELAGGTVLFASGQFQQNTPYAALAGALGALLVRLLGLETERLAHWRERLLAATAPHAHLLAQWVPELEWLTGPLPPGNEPPGGDARLRLINLFLRALRALNGPEHPLVLFFDNAHRLDDESLAVLRELRSEDFNHLLLLVAYRNDSPAHPPALERLIAHGQSLQVPFTELTLAPLSLADTRAMVDAALSLTGARARAVAEHLHERGGGNPLFVTQALHVIREQPGPPSLAPLSPSLDIVGLMATRMARLPEPTRQLLHSIALLGQQVPKDELAAATGLAPSGLDLHLDPALRAGLIRVEHANLVFSHDHVRETAHGLVSVSDARAEHALIASRLVAALGPAPSSERLFRLAVHILKTEADGVCAPWRQRFVEVLILAARRAKEAAAAPFALEYLACAEQLLITDHSVAARESHYDLAFLRAQCLILNADYRRADQHIARLLQQAQAPWALSSLYVLKCECLALAGDYAGAVDAALDGLANLDLHLSARPDDAQAEQAWQQLQQALEGSSIDALRDLPLLDDPQVAGLIQLLACAVLPGSFLHPELMFMLLCHLVRLTVRHGVCALGAENLAWFGVANAHRRDAHAEGFAWTQLALHLVEQHNYHNHRAPVLLAHSQLSVWLRPLPYALGYADQALRDSQARDMPSMGCYANNHIVSDLLVIGAPIERILRQIDLGLGMARNLEFVDSQNILFTQALYIRRLAGTPSGATAIPDRAQMAARMAHCTTGRSPFWWHLFEGLFFYLEGHFVEAGRHMDQAWALCWVTPAHIHHIDLALFSLLNAAALHDGSAAADLTLQRPLQRLRYLSALNPKVFGDRLDLAEAEVLRAQGCFLQALVRYDQAVAKARACGAVHIQGLAHELASRCHQHLGLEVSTRAHQRHARDAWRRWGAVALAEQMEAAHPFLQEQPLTTRASIELPGGQQQLDQLSITKACQALSREIELDSLIKTLLTNTLIHAGASHAALLLTQAGELRIEACGRATPEGVEVTLSGHVARPDELPLSLVRSAMRSRQSLLIDGPHSLDRFADDPYLQRPLDGSRLCVPLLKQNEVIGALYLDNPLAQGVFSAARVDVLEVLAAQAAISITTARLYSDLLEENRRRRVSESTLRTSRALLAIGKAVSRHGSFTWKPSLDRSFWSPELFAELRLSPHQAPAGPARRLELAGHVHPDDRARFDQTLQTASRTLSAFRLEFRVLAADGEVHYLEALGEPDEAQGYLGVIFDITERQRTEASLRSARAELARISQATVLGELAASIAHEINQPLASILSNASASLRWLDRSQPAVQEAMVGLRDIVGQSQRAADIVTALRALARQAPPDRKPVRVDEVVRHVIALTRAELADRHITVELALAPLAPLPADAVQLQQVILNLVNNAADALQILPPSERRLHVHAQTIPGGVLVLVEDSGPGIAPKDQGEIFKAFYTTKPSGMGMGLAICASIVQAHGGTLLAQTGRRGETLFGFTLKAP